MSLKRCYKCNKEKSLELFAKGKKYADGRRNICKSCHSAYITQYYKDRPDKYAVKLKAASVHRPSWKRHGLTKERYQELLAKYDGKCHSCQDRVGRNIDHDHFCCDKMFSCGKCVRGVLCNQCNTALGLLSDNPKKVQNLLDYIS